MTEKPKGKYKKAAVSRILILESGRQPSCIETGWKLQLASGLTRPQSGLNCTMERVFLKRGGRKSRLFEIGFHVLEAFFTDRLSQISDRRVLAVTQHTGSTIFISRDVV